MNDKVQEIFVEDIIPNRFQPRLTFDEKALQELSDSIKVHGVIQPLVLRKVGNKYEIIAGERRYKASCMAGLKKVPAIVRELSDNESAEIALIENIQRKNLSSIEEAQSYKNLLERGYLTQDDLAKKLGVAQSTIANKLRLLNLCDEVQNALLNEQISERHARSLLQLENPDEQKSMLDRVIKERLTVKQLDNEIRKMLQGSGDDKGNRTTGGKVMEPNQDIKKEDNQVVDTDTAVKNLFGFNFQPPTDLEESPANLKVGEEDVVPPVSFNPFGGTDMSAMAEQPQSEELETFDMFGDVVTPGEPVEKVSSVEDEGIAADVQPGTSKNIGDQITNIRNAVHSAEDNGFRVELEEYDFEDMYQVVIKIRK